MEILQPETLGPLHDQSAEFFRLVARLVDTYFPRGDAVIRGRVIALVAFGETAEALALLLQDLAMTEGDAVKLIDQVALSADSVFYATGLRPMPSTKQSWLSTRRV
jgi:hypothetical protein